MTFIKKVLFVFAFLSFAILAVSSASAMMMNYNPNPQGYSPIETNYQVSYQPLSESFTPTYNVKVSTLATNYYYPPMYADYIPQNNFINAAYAPVYNYNAYNSYPVYSYPSYAYRPAMYQPLYQPYTTTTVHYFHSS